MVWIAAQWRLTKPGLTLFVVFSALMGAMVAGQVDLLTYLALGVGGYAITAASNIGNQVLEKDRDARMPRTCNRPLPKGILSQGEAVISFFIWATLGIWVLAWGVGWQSATLGVVALGVYTFAYTPLKKKGPVAVLVGALAGALPPLIGYFAQKHSLNAEALTLFLMQYVWQLPHFWAIAWFAYEGYARADYYLLPYRHRNTASAVAVTISGFSLSLIGVLAGLLLGWGVGIAWTLLGLYVGYYSYEFYVRKTDASARKLMFASLWYLLGAYISLWLIK
ncbi:MAG: protoheme IX farnesyltransferase [Bacteroidia bacterium]